MSRPNQLLKDLFGEENNKTPLDPQDPKQIHLSPEELLQLIRTQPNYEKWIPPAQVNIRVLTLFDNPYLHDTLYDFVLRYEQALAHNSKKQHISQHFIFMDRNATAESLSRVGDLFSDFWEKPRELYAFINQAVAESNRLYNSKGKHYCIRTFIQSYHYSGIKTRDIDWYEENKDKLVQIVDWIFLRMLKESTFVLFHKYKECILQWMPGEYRIPSLLKHPISFGKSYI